MTNPDGATQPKAEEGEKGDFKKNVSLAFGNIRAIKMAHRVVRHFYFKISED
jgi:hypothetical protein